MKLLPGRLGVGGDLPAAVNRAQGRHGPHQGAAGVAEVAAAAPEPGHEAQGFGRQAGVDMRPDRLKDTLGSVQAGLEIGLGPGLHLGNHFFRGHPKLLNPESI
jgi:hypothetical protein